MLDMDYLEKRGVSDSAYKKIFTTERQNMTGRQKKLVDLLSQRSRDGFLDSIQDWKAWFSVDCAYEVPFNQTTPTLVNHILSKNLNETQTREALKSYGLSESELFLEIPHPQDPMRTAWIPNPPVFFQIYIPIVKAYLEAILAQIYNERNTSPLLLYKPLKNTKKNQTLCEVVTDIVDTMSTWYGYGAVLRQSIQQMLKYGTMLAFPREEWHCEKQIVNWNGKPETLTVKEGIRYMHPHPTRMFYDMQYPLTSFNTDTGCSFAGHWHILKYRDVVENRMYWNRKAIFGGTNWFQAPGIGNYFNEVYPCRQKFLELAAWDKPPLREDRASWYSTTSDMDKAVFVTEHFMKLVPDDWDLTNPAEKGKGYKYPIWHRFTLAGDDTVVWAAPCAYTPAWFMGYDYDEMAAHNASFALELIPWQDHLGMILSQMLLTAKSNLLDVTFYDNQAIDKQDIEKMVNRGEQKYRSKQFIGYDSLIARASNHPGMEKVFTNVNFTKQPIQEFLQMVGTILNIMERVLGISAQATGAAATHQQSKQEVIQTSVSSTNRIAKISSAVDEGTDAWMRQLYEGHQAYGDNQFVAEVSSDVEDLDKTLEALGLKKGDAGDGTLIVSGHKHKLRLEGFASVNKGPRHDKEKEMAQTIFQTVGTIAGQEELFKKIGAKNLLILIEQAAILAGAPRDFKLRLDPDAEKNNQVPQNVIEAITKAQQATLQAVEEKIGKPVAQEVAQDQQAIQQMQTVLKKLEGIYKIAEAAQQKTEVDKQRTTAKIQTENAKAQATEHRKNLAQAAEEKRKDQALIAQLQRDAALLNQKLAAMQAELDAKLKSEKAKADSAAQAAPAKKE